MSSPPLWGQGVRGQKGVKGSKAYYILGYRVPTTSVGQRERERKGVKGSEAYCVLGLGSHHLCGARGEGAIEQRGVKGSKAYCILGFRVPSTSVRARGEEAKEAKHIVH